MPLKPREAYQPPLLTLRTPREIHAHLDRYVIGQEKAKRTIAIAAYNHLKRLTSPRNHRSRLIKKANILMVGPSGCGKTHIARSLAEFLELPFARVDATEYTEAGYYGKDVELMVSELLVRSAQSVEGAERGVVFIDEVDKLARRDHGARTGAGSRDIGGLGVQQALLKMLEGGTVYVPLGMAPQGGRPDYVPVDTSDILFICAGAFSDLVRKRRDQDIGFTEGRPRAAGERESLSTEDLVDYGFLVEFLGRLPVVVELEALTQDDLVKILTVPPDAILKEYRELLAMDDVDLHFEREAVIELARAARRRRTGARALRTLVESVMHDIMFEAPERRGQRVLVDAAQVRGALEAGPGGAR